MSINGVVNLLLMLPFLMSCAKSDMMKIPNKLLRPEVKFGSSAESLQLAAPVPFVTPSGDTASPSSTTPTSGLKCETPVPSQVLAPDVMLDPNIPIPSSHSMLGEPSRVCVYNIHVKTGNEWGAGTDSTISMQLTSSNSSDLVHEVLFELPDFDSDSNKFEVDNDDTFQVHDKCVTNICRMILSTDHEGWFADWFVERVSVTIADGAPTEYHNWILQQWLPSTGGPLSIVKDDC